MPQAAIDYAVKIGEEEDEDVDDPDRWLWVHCQGPPRRIQRHGAVHRRR